MPFSVKKGGGDCAASKWAVINDDTGDTMGCHDTKAKALKQQAALYANVEDAARHRIQADRAIELVTIPNVELVEVGTWQTSTGEATWTTEHLEAAVAAQDDPGYRTPIVKLGHVDPRFDGEPAFGHIINLRLSDDKMTLLGDLAGVPKWLAQIMPSAYPDRSIEGWFGLTTATGTQHAFAVTAVALLGVADPAISTLDDIKALFTAEPEPAVAGSGVAVVLSSRSMRTRKAQASVNIDSVRQAFYDQQPPGSWAWIREFWSDFLIVDNDQGDLFKIPWSEDGDNVVFGDAEKVAVQYVPAPASDEQKGLVLLSRVPVRANSPTGQEGADMALLDDLRARLREAGVEVADDADEDTVLGLMVERLTAETPPEGEGEGEEGEGEGEGTGEASGNPAGELPEGFVAVPQATVAEMANASKRLATLERREHERSREALLARYATKVIPAARSEWERTYDRQGHDATEALLSKQPDVVPLSPRGHDGEGESLDDELYSMLYPSEKGGSA